MGLVLTAEGPKVLEFNVRLGDPETQALLPRMTTDLVDVLEGARPKWSRDAAVNVVLAAEGYPESPVKGASIHGLDAVPDDVLVFHAGTRSEGKKLLVDGGRVLNVVGLGSSVSEARTKAYETVQALSCPGMQFRTDIAGSVVAVAEHEGDAGRRGSALGNRVLPQPLTGATHHHQVSPTEVEPDRFSTAFGPDQKPPRATQGDGGDDRMGQVRGRCGRHARRPSRCRFGTSRR